MKLIRCYVSSFGKLKDFSFDFESDLTTIKENNGWGKSTLATFIKAIFYGLNDSKRSVAENERLKYKPWNSIERFGGYIEFVWGKNKFKLERFFGSKESEDTVRLFDLDTGKEYTNTENLGKRIFEIDEDGFLSTTYFSQKDFQIKSNASITAKYNSVCEVDNSELFEKALSSIENKAKTYKSRGDKGLIADARRELFDVNDQIQSANKVSLTVSSLKDSAELLERQTNELKKLAQKLTDDVASAGKAEADAIRKERYLKLQSEKNVLMDKKANFEKVLNGNLPDLREVNACIECNNELSSVVARENDIKNDLAVVERQGNEKPKERKKLFVLSALYCSLLVLGVIFMILGGTMLYIGIGSVAIWAILEIVSFATCMKKKGNSQSGVVAELINKKRTELCEYVEIKSKYTEHIDAFIKKYNVEEFTDRQSALLTIKNATENYLEIVKKIAEIDAECLNFDRAILSFDSSEISDLSELKKQLSTVQSEYSIKASELAKKRASIKYYDDVMSSIPELNAKKAELTEKIAQYKDDFDLLNLTADYLKKADETLKIKYRKPLQDSLNKYLSYITNTDSKANIDIDFNVTLEENGMEKIADYYSKGYQNLFEICKRFALADVLFTAEKPFIILDDPFYNLDDEKIKYALELIQKLSEEYQIIYLVCHESRRPVNA